MEKLEKENIYMKCQRKKTTLRVKIKAKKCNASTPKCRCCYIKVKPYIFLLERSEQGHLMPANKIKMTVKNLLLTASPLEVVECPFFAILKPLVLPFLCCGFFIWSPSTAVARVEAMVAQLVFRYCCCSYCSVVDRERQRNSRCCQGTSTSLCQ